MSNPNNEEVNKSLARLARYDSMLSEVMPADFKDWHQNSKEEWPEIAAAVIKNLREDRDLAWEFAVKSAMEVAQKGVTD